MGVSIGRPRPGRVIARRLARHVHRGPLRPRPDDARLDPRPRPARGPLRRGARLAARGVRDRRPARRPPPHGARGDGRAHRRREGVHPRPRLARRAAARGRLTGTTIRFPSPTVTGTENVLFAAALARGTTVIENAAREPEVVDAARLLDADGRARDGRRHGDDRGRGRRAARRHGRAPHAVVPDRIEAGTYLAAGAITGGDVTVSRARPGDLEAFLDALRRPAPTSRRGGRRARLRRAARSRRSTSRRRRTPASRPTCRRSSSRS